MNIEQVVKKSGFSYVEILFALFLFINLFVLFQQIFYNMNNNEERFLYQHKILSYEVVSLRIESQLKEAKDIIIGEGALSFTYKQQNYRYSVFNHYFSVQINGIRQYLLKDIENVSFSTDSHFIYINFEDRNSYITSSRIVFYGPS